MISSLPTSVPVVSRPVRRPPRLVTGYAKLDGGSGNARYELFQLSNLKADGEDQPH